MIIRKKDNIYTIKILKENLSNFNIFDSKDIRNLFSKIILKLKEKYHVSGLLDINIYTNDAYGMIMKITPLKYYKEEVDLKIHFYLDCIFLAEISSLENESEVYYYKNKYYSIYNQEQDSNIIYDTKEILEKGIRVI